MKILAGQKLIVNFKPIPVDSELYEDYEWLDDSLVGAGCGSNGFDFIWIENGIYIANRDTDLFKYEKQRIAAKVEFKILGN